MKVLIKIYRNRIENNNGKFFRKKSFFFPGTPEKDEAGWDRQEPDPTSPGRQRQPEDATFDDGAGEIEDKRDQEHQRDRAESCSKDEELQWEEDEV